MAGPPAQPAGADTATSLPDKEVGRRTYAAYCSTCHGADGRGGTPLAKLFRVAPPDLTRIAARRGGWFPEVLVRELIDGRSAGHGARDMPVWGRVLTQQEMPALTGHLFAIQDPALGVEEESGRLDDPVGRPRAIGGLGSGGGSRPVR